MFVVKCLLEIDAFLCVMSTVKNQEYCTEETFSARCDTNEIIVMEKALYGRMKIGRCVTADMGYLGCHKDVLPQMDKMCSGKKECTINKLAKGDFPDVPSCMVELQLYLEVQYTCVKGKSIPLIRLL